MQLEIRFDSEDSRTEEALSWKIDANQGDLHLIENKI